MSRMGRKEYSGMAGNIRNTVRITSVLMLWNRVIVRYNISHLSLARG
jgi:hypothetical protein